MTPLTLVSHHLCPYVQRAAISLAEKSVPFKRVYVDLANKPDWFKTLSPLGKVPLLSVGTSGRESTIFESAVILEYLEETLPRPLHPQDPLERAQHRGWIEFGSAMLNAIARLYNAKDEAAFDREAAGILAMGAQLEAELARRESGPYFSGETFSLVDAVFGPIFRYFDTFEAKAGLALLDGKPKIKSWRAILAGRPSVRDAVSDDYPDRLLAFLKARGSVITARIAERVH